MQAPSQSDASLNDEFEGVTPRTSRHRKASCGPVERPKGSFTCVTEWRFIETYRGTTHLVGRVGLRGTLWATPPIIEVDLFVSHVVAENGRTYVLLGEPGVAAIATYFLALFAAFDERLVESNDVTESFVAVKRMARLAGELEKHPEPNIPRDKHQDGT